MVSLNANLVFVLTNDEVLQPAKDFSAAFEGMNEEDLCMYAVLVENVAVEYIDDTEQSSST